MKTQRARYQKGSIKRVSRAKGHAWEVRFSEWKDGKRHQRTLTFDGARYPKEADVRKAIELNVSQVNSGTASEKVDAKFSAITALYRREHLPTLEHSTRQLHEYLLARYIEEKLGSMHLRDVRPLVIDRWLKELNLAATTKASIRTVLSQCFRLAALHEFIPPMGKNPMSLIKLKGVSKRQKPIEGITVEQFREIFGLLPEPLNIMLLVDGALGLRISELLALKWEDMDETVKTIKIRRKFTRGRIGKTKSDASEAVLPLADSLLTALQEWKLKTDESEWVFPSPRTGGPRSASMLLQKGLKPAAEKAGIKRITWHTLRHACRSWLSSGGAAPGTQKDLLRHADISTTANIYGHALSADMREAHEELVDKLMQTA
ncbi:MAG: site-specific integrase [Terracidiphilus sp.]